MPGPHPSAFLARLPDEDAATLRASAHPRRFSRGETLFFEGDDAREVLVLTSGQVKIWITAPNGREVILAVFDPDELLGELSAIDGTPRSASATAISDVEVLALSLHDFAALVDEQPKIANALLHTVAARLRETSQRQLEFGTADALGRLARCILGLADRYGRDCDAGRRLRIPLVQQELAAWTGLSREAVVKGLQAMRALGWVQSAGRQLTVLDDGALRARATG
jgi:CRP/FNR family cyclic AMP-dependent transcriptional regulator